MLWWIGCWQFVGPKHYLLYSTSLDPKKESNQAIRLLLSRLHLFIAMDGIAGEKAIALLKHRIDLRKCCGINLGTCDRLYHLNQCDRPLQLLIRGRAIALLHHGIDLRKCYGLILGGAIASIT
ncbi:MAG: hypothetical protein F6K19_29235 [Cyanothece sp. SIO1E1]|nr:hypothetical protein [Cyanothece sp. SIO1E1]